MTLPLLRPTVAEVDLKKLSRNLHKIKMQVGEGVGILVPLKANAYGHGAEGVGRFLEENVLCQFFGTASVEEGMQ